MCVNIRFDNLKCAVKEKLRGRKAILNSVSGTFYSGKLTGILGASGAGKTTLLNVLAGYLTKGVTGNIYVNEVKKNGTQLKEISTYLMQDNTVQPFLTVQESLMIAAALKLGNEDELKRRIVRHVTVTLGLTECFETRSESLSGGQRKRLSIALELINDPFAIFLDEPTSGLDEISTKMCVEFLKTLTCQGKTIVCTIHQPSNSTLKLFDHLFFLDEGHCIYNGAVGNLVTFLSCANFPCPTTYNPADYIIEISHTSKENRTKLMDCVQLTDEVETESMNKELSFLKKSNKFQHKQEYLKQVSILLHRSFLQLTRNKFNIFFQCFHFTMCGLVIGGMFFDFGQDAKHLFHNFTFCMVVIVYLIFSSSIARALAYPFEFKLSKNEIYNGWYDINAYYTSLSLISLPIPIIMGMFFTVLIYLMSNQICEMDRFLKFYLIVIITIIISESHGKAVGICCNATHGSIVAPGSMLPFIALSFYGFGYASQLHKIVKIIMQISFARYSLVGAMSALYNNRSKIECSEIYCHYNDPQIFLADMGMEGAYDVQIVGLVIFMVLYKCLVYSLLRINLYFYTK